MEKAQREMKVMQSTQRNFSILGIGIKQSNERCRFNRRNFLALFILGLASVSSYVQLFHVASNFQEYTDAVYMAVSTTGTAAELVICMWKMRPLFGIITRLESIVNSRLSYPMVRSIYKRVNPKLEKWCDFVVFLAMKILYPIAMLTIFAVSYVTYFMSKFGFLDADLQNDAFLMPFPYWFPFDYKSPLRYLAAFILQSISIIDLYFFVSCCVSLGIGIYMLVMALVEDIKTTLSSINGNVKSERNELHVMLKIYDTLEFHSTAMRLVRDTSAIAQPVFMVLFSWSCITICGGFLMITMGITNEKNSVVLVVPVVELFVAFALVFISCELAGRISVEFDHICDIIANSDWYLFPMPVKKVLPTILINAQQEVYFECFGSIPCNRDTFKRVTKSGFSYFMMLRQFGM